MKKNTVIELLKEFDNENNAFITKKKAIENDNDLTGIAKSRRLGELNENYILTAKEYVSKITEAVDEVLNDYHKILVEKATSYANDSGHQTFINNCISLINNKRTLSPKERLMIEGTLKDDVLGISLINSRIDHNSNVIPFEIPEDKTELFLNLIKENLRYCATSPMSANTHGAIIDTILKIDENFDENFNFISND
ncbi:hypothetical protein [Thomasclavelia cocleata]|uniref:hypothetical protein n=1 Tax=Thomasclavelia cocleata TaxID=69824 RepID=UPI00242DC8A7|nr:hypothetical protein [Thomasclavelia cocleata]